MRHINFPLQGKGQLLQLNSIIRYAEDCYRNLTMRDKDVRAFCDEAASLLHVARVVTDPHHYAHDDDPSHKRDAELHRSIQNHIVTHVNNALKRWNIEARIIDE